MIIKTIRIWDSPQDLKQSERWLSGILTTDLMFCSAEQKESIKFTGRVIKNPEDGLDYKSLLQRWLKLSANASTKGIEKLVDDYELETDATFEDIIDSIPVFASFEIRAEDEGEGVSVRIAGVKSGEDPKEIKQEVEIRACEISFL